jgi:hypothetical protein
LDPGRDPGHESVTFEKKGQNNLLLMRQEIPLTEAEVAAVGDGASALESLLKRLAAVSTSGGPAPLQLSDSSRTESEAAD